MRLNPIVKKDIKVQARSMKMAWGIFAYEAILAGVFFIALLFISNQSIYDDSNVYSKIVSLYPVLAIVQIMIIAIVIPVQTSSAISGEKERQTFDIMMTTSMTPFSIIAGKVMTAMIQGIFFVVAGMPVMALAFVIGGMSWAYLFWFLAIAVLVSLFSASIGIFCSSVCKKSITAVIMSYGIYVIFFVVTAIPNMICNILGYTVTGNQVTMIFYLINPAGYLMEFFIWTMSGYSSVYEMLAFSSQGVKGSQLSAAAVHYGWMALSSILFILVSVFFLWIAAKRINPISKRKARKLAMQNQSS